MTSKPRTVLLGVGALSALVLVSGCQSHLGTAATVGSERVTVKDLDTAYKAAALTTSGKAAGAKLQGQVLTELVQNKQVLALADSRHVVVSQGDIDAAYKQLIAGAAANQSDQPDSYYRLNAQTQANALALMKDFSGATHKVDAVDLYAVPVKDKATGQTVLGLLTKNPGDAPAIAKKYSDDPSLAAAGGEADIVPLDQLGVPALATQPLDAATVDTIGTTIVVLEVRARLDEADFTAALDAGAPVKLNPRFGTWGQSVDSQTGNRTFSVLPATSDIVAPDTAAPSIAASANPLGGADQQPAPSAAPSAESSVVAPSSQPSAGPAPSASS